MKMNKKGFTLIELLAIIVILAIIAVITVPIILNIIDNAKSGAAKDSVIGYGKAVELAYTQYQYDTQLNAPVAAVTPTYDGKTVSLTGSGITGSLVLAVDYDGEQVKCNGGTLTDGKIKLTGCQVGTDTATTYIYGKGKACLTPATDTTTDCD
ncbi:MAG: prepilin-type N-terminal cleavage/methylation domain-containing protein [Bacilli bacterium]